MRVLILLVRHGTSKYPDALTDLEDIYQRRAPDLIRNTIIVDNALPTGAIERLDRDIVVIGGNNTSWEFSGWQQAIDHLRGELEAYDAIHFVTSAFRTHYVAYLERFSAHMIKVVATRPIAVGHIDYYPYPIRFGTYVSRHWIRSSFWLISPAELLRLGTLNTVHNPTNLFSKKEGWPFDINGLLSPGYQSLIHSWLTSDQGTGQDTTWHSRFDLTAETLARFQEKSIAIINEHLLSVRLRAQGTHLLDMTYLSELVDGGQPLPEQFPGWRKQIELRHIPGHDHIDDVIWR